MWSISSSEITLEKALFLYFLAFYVRNSSEAFLCTETKRIAYDSLLLVVFHRLFSFLMQSISLSEISSKNVPLLLFLAFYGRNASKGFQRTETTLKSFESSWRVACYGLNYLHQPNVVGTK